MDADVQETADQRPEQAGDPYLRGERHRVHPFTGLHMRHRGKEPEAYPFEKEIDRPMKLSFTSTGVITYNSPRREYCW